MPKVIVLDPGHDTADPGSTQYDGESERHYTMALAQAVRQELLSRYDCEVLLTHTGAGAAPGRSLAEELRARAEVANRAGAALFVSLHHNAGPTSARGGELYVWTNLRAPDGGLVWLPAVDGSTVNHRAPQGYAAAQAMLPSIRDTLANIGIPWRGDIKCADLAVLRHTQGPAVLVETHFGTNPQDDALMDDPTNVQRLAVGIATGIARAAGLTAKAASPFPDVPADAWYAQDVADLYRFGIVRGDADGLFHPNQSATKAEIARLIRLTIRYITGN